jgi:hypothetical protein
MQCNAVIIGDCTRTRACITQYVRMPDCCSRVMIRNVLTQSAFQLGITLWMVYNGAEVFGITREYVCTNGFGCAKDNSQDELNYADKSVIEYLNTFIFNTFVICQVCDDVPL